MQRFLQFIVPGAPAMLLTLAMAGCDDGAKDRGSGTEPGTANQTESEQVVPSSWGGAEIYDEVCDKCHKMGVDGAPELGDVEAWAPRIAQGKEVLFSHLRAGFKEMPARGRCDSCSDSQLQAALDYMISNSR